MTTEEKIALTIVKTFVGKIVSLLFNILSRFVIAFLSRSESLFNLMAAITVNSDFGVQENKICHCFHIFPFYLPSPLLMLILHWALDGVQEAGEHSTVVAGMVGVSDPLTQAHPLNPAPLVSMVMSFAAQFPDTLLGSGPRGS